MTPLNSPESAKDYIRAVGPSLTPDALTAMIGAQSSRLARISDRETKERIRQTRAVLRRYQSTRSN